MLATLQALGEYGALTGKSSGDAATLIGTKITNILSWAQDHQTAVIVGIIAGVAVVWWATNPRV
jgi:hypothetical protein